MKKLILTFFAVMCCMSGFAIGEKIGELYYTLFYANNTAVVTYNGEHIDYSGSIIIPSTVNYDSKQFTVTGIGGYAFDGCFDLTSITIPSSVTSIGDNAFSNCTGLTSLFVLATNLPSIGENAFKNVNKNIPVYVPDVEKYNNWGGFTNIKNYLDYFKQLAKDEINAAKKGIELSDEDTETVSTYIGLIESATDTESVDAAKAAALAIISLRPTKDAAIAAIDDAMDGITTLTEADIQSIYSYKTAINNATTEEGVTNNKAAALGVISLQKAKDAAIAEIQEEMQGETGSAYLNGLVKEHVNAINASTDESTITSNKETAISKLKAVVTAYKDIKSAELGSLSTPQTNCPAVKVTKGDKVVILYAPDAVEMIKIPANE